MRPWQSVVRRKLQLRRITIGTGVILWRWSSDVASKVTFRTSLSPRAPAQGSFLGAVVFTYPAASYLRLGTKDVMPRLSQADRAWDNFRTQPLRRSARQAVFPWPRQEAIHDPMQRRPAIAA
jgi:hypothetical protein